MSLKARIEAVIYAAEEPVTLAQLGALFQLEALEHRRVRRAEEAAAAEIEAEAEIQIEDPISAVPEMVVPAEPGESAETVDPAASAGFGGTAEAPEEEKRAQRLRDREVREELRRVLDELIADYETGDRGMEIREIAGGYRVATKPEYHDAVRGFIKSLKPPMKLSLQALETLAVVAYKQPVTAPEVSEIRGVDSAGVLGSLMSRKLITTAGRKQVIGRPILYKTTKEFLLRFGLKDLNDLPSMEEFEKMAGELADLPEDEPGDLPFEETRTALDHEGEARARAAVAVSDDTAEDAADVPGVAVDMDAEHESEDPADRGHDEAAEGSLSG